MMQRILVVDDEDKMRRIYRKLLSFEGYEVVEARDAGEASKLLESDKGINLILLDINMPLVSGVTLYDIIRRIYGDSVKVIVSSVYPLEEQKRMIRADDFYDKAQGTDILLKKIKRVLQ